MTYYRGEADPAYREYCAKIAGLKIDFLNKIATEL